jgi:hypothetical protein
MKAMPPSSEAKTGTRRKRLQLSCSECRRKKLSCDRIFPCRRCVRTGRSEQCSFDTETGPLVLNSQLAQQAKHNSDEVRELRAEVAQLRALLSGARLPQESDLQTVANTVPGDDVQAQLGRVVEDQNSMNILTVTNSSVKENVSGVFNFKRTNNADQENLKAPVAEVLDPRERTSSRYYSQHTLMRFFTEVRIMFVGQ